MILNDLVPGATQLLYDRYLRRYLDAMAYYTRDVCDVRPLSNTSARIVFSPAGRSLVPKSTYASLENLPVFVLALHRFHLTYPTLSRLLATYHLAVETLFYSRLNTDRSDLGE